MSPESPYVVKGLSAAVSASEDDDHAGCAAVLAEVSTMVNTWSRYVASASELDPAELRFVDVQAPGLIQSLIACAASEQNDIRFAERKGMPVPRTGLRTRNLELVPNGGSSLDPKVVELFLGNGAADQGSAKHQDFVDLHRACGVSSSVAGYDACVWLTYSEVFSTGCRRWL